MYLYAYCAHAKVHRRLRPESRDIARWCNSCAQKCDAVAANSAAANLQPFAIRCGICCATRICDASVRVLRTYESAWQPEPGVKRQIDVCNVRVGATSMFRNVLMLLQILQPQTCNHSWPTAVLAATQQRHTPECALSTAASVPWSKAGVKRCCIVVQICGQKHSVATANSMPANR